MGALLALITATAATAQITNTIPPNIFLTDDGKVFWYKPGQRLVDVKKIRAAQASKESRPASQDPDGHWGIATNGLQLSLRFKKLAFTKGEPVVVTLLLRNVTNSPVTFLRALIPQQPSPINVLVFKDGKQLPVEGEKGKIEVTSANTITIYPQTQLKYSVKLNDFYNLTIGGDFLVQAIYDTQGEISSQKVLIEIDP